MKRWFIISVLGALIIGGSFLLDSCKKHRPFSKGTPIPFVSPQGYPNPTYNFSGNPLTEEGFQLGKKLFFDGRLSSTGNVYCGSCHQPLAAFTTFEHDRSHGVNGNHTLRNAPGLFNLAWYPYFNQDGSANSLWKVYEDHITNPKEMGETITNVLNKLQQDADYKTMFRAAFGEETITKEKMFKALDQFVINLVSADSKYDKVTKGQASFTSQEQNGHAVFQNKCATCHSGILFTDFSFRNIGLEIDPSLNDFGRMRVTGNPADSLRFRVPSLRNLDFTSYYFHDGRINFPRNVLKFYETGVNQGPTLDPLLTNGISLTPTEENNLIDFLRTLSDSTFLNNPRFRP
ncbi:MAG TPA: cytochrome c peroxidase [Flavisolibacter sp.]|nr:cytochrome c peroxidase [Flavisolibacter sp.]